MGFDPGDVITLSLAVQPYIYWALHPLHHPEAQPITLVHEEAGSWDGSRVE